MSERKSDLRTWTIYVCPECEMETDLRLRRPEDVRCYGVAGNHAGTTVEAVRVVREVDAVRLRHEFQEKLTQALNAAGVPAQPSWQEAIDYLVEREAVNVGDAHQEGYWLGYVAGQKDAEGMAATWPDDREMMVQKLTAQRGYHGVALQRDLAERVVSALLGDVGVER